MPDSLFRKSSLEKLYSPEQLDKLLVVIKPKGWIALWTLLLLLVALFIWAAVAEIPVQVTLRGIIRTPKQFFTIRSLEEGSVVEIKVKKGDVIEVGQPLFVLYNSTTNSRFTVTSPIHGTIFRLEVNLQDYATKGTPLLYADQALENGEQLEALAYIPMTLKDQIKVGMRSDVLISQQQLNGKVVYVSPYSLSKAEILQGVPSDKWLQYLNPSNDPVLEVIVSLDQPSSLAPGDLCVVLITQAEKKPLRFFIP